MAQRRRVSTKYKRFLREEDPLASLPTSSKKQFLEQYTRLGNENRAANDTSSHNYSELPDSVSDHTDWQFHGHQDHVAFEQLNQSTEGSGSISVQCTNASPRPTSNSESAGCSDPNLQWMPDADSDTTRIDHESSEDFINTFKEKLVAREKLLQETLSDTDTNPFSDNGDDDDDNDEFSRDTGDNMTDERGFPTIDEQTPLFENAQITLGVSMLLIITFANKYGLPTSGLQDLLILAGLHCQLGHVLPQTLYAFKNWFKDARHQFVSHKYCSSCLLQLEGDEGTCKNDICGNNLTEESNVSSFIEISVYSQLQNFFQRAGFFDKLMYQKARRKQQCNNIEDIFDGDLYKKTVMDCTKNSELVLTLVLNTDGASPFKSSKKSMWPIFLAINELPPSERWTAENLILAGLWTNKKKPLMMSFIAPLFQEIRQLERTGFTFHHNGSDICIKVVLLCNVCDLPARASLCNMNQYNGEASCIKCEQPGKTLKIGKGHTKVFLPDLNNLFGPERTDENVKQNAVEAVQEKHHVKGIKGPSWLSCLLYFSFVKGTCVDYMHGVLLGVTSSLFKFWFTPKYKDSTFSLYDYYDLVNVRLSKIKPPDCISRLPRSMYENAQWKASEWRNWLFYYAPTILNDLMDQKVLTNFMCLSESIYLLSQDSISPGDLKRSEELIIRFVCMFPVLYQENFMTLNFHQLLHLPNCVKDLGPLWCFSCFPFENANGYILNLIHGTQCIDLQVVQALGICQKIPQLAQSLIQDSPAQTLYCRMKKVTFSRIKDHAISKNIFVAGATVVEKEFPEDQMTAIIDLVGSVKNIYTFKRVRIKNDIFHSVEYMRVKLRNSCVISYKVNSIVDFGIIIKFVQVEHECNCEIPCSSLVRNLVILKPLQPSGSVSPDKNRSHVRQVNVSNALRVVDISCIQRKCVFIDVDCDNTKQSYICDIPNSVEKD